MNQRQQQTHQLQSDWKAEDYARQSASSAKVAQQYHQLISQQAGVIQADMAAINQRLQKSDREVAKLKSELKRVESNSGENRNVCLTWGIGGAVLGGLVINLLLAPSTPQVVPQQRPVMQRGMW